MAIWSGAWAFVVFMFAVLPPVPMSPDSTNTTQVVPVPAVGAIALYYFLDYGPVHALGALVLLLVAAAVLGYIGFRRLP